VLESRREGTSVYYRIKDPRMLQLLEVARQILTTNLTESQALLGQLADTAPPVAP
jgi:ArsR family transcriptional regulator